MNRLLPAFIVLIGMLTTVASFEAVAQTRPQVQESAGTKVTFDKDDLLNAMKSAERQDFLDRRQELKDLQADGRKLDKGSPGRKVLAAAFQAKQDEFDKKFDHLRGFNGKSVTVHGNPPPNKRDIMRIVMNGGRSSPGLHQHWTRDEHGNVVGGASPPKIETASKPTASEVSPAEPTLSPRSYGNNGCTHGIYGIPDDTPECRAAMNGQ